MYLVINPTEILHTVVQSAILPLKDLFTILALDQSHGTHILQVVRNLYHVRQLRERPIIFNEKLGAVQGALQGTGALNGVLLEQVLVADGLLFELAHAVSVWTHANQFDLVQSIQVILRWFFKGVYLLAPRTTNDGVLVGAHFAENVFLAILTRQRIIHHFVARSTFKLLEDFLGLGRVRRPDILYNMLRFPADLLQICNHLIPSLNPLLRRLPIIGRLNELHQITLTIK